MNTLQYLGILEVDPDRGVIYFHSTESRVIAKIQTPTLLQIRNLPTPIPSGRALDVIHMHGADWGPNEEEPE